MKKILKNLKNLIQQIFRRKSKDLDFERYQNLEAKKYFKGEGRFYE